MFLWGVLGKVRYGNFICRVVNVGNGANDKNARLFTRALLLTIIIYIHHHIFFLFNAVNVTIYIRNIKKKKKRKIRFR